MVVAMTSKSDRILLIIIILLLSSFLVTATYQTTVILVRQYWEKKQSYAIRELDQAFEKEKSSLEKARRELN